MPKLSPEAARERAERAARFLAADERVKLVFLYRDVYLAFLTDPPLGLDESRDLRADVERQAGSEINLVSLSEASVALAREAAVTGCCLYANPPELQEEYVSRANMMYLDFKWYSYTEQEIQTEREDALQYFRGGR